MFLDWLKKILGSSSKAPEIQPEAPINSEVSGESSEIATPAEETPTEASVEAK